MLKSFFFWGIFTRKKTVLKYMKHKPKLFKNAKFRKTKGKYCDFSNLSDEEFFRILEILDRGIECAYHRVTITCVLSSSKEKIVYVYVPMDVKDFNKFFD